MSSSRSPVPTVSDDDLVELLEAEHPLTSQEVGVITGLGSPLHAHNRLMLVYGVSGGVETERGVDPDHRLWWPEGELTDD